tara:strand:+ start:133 stop:546 length:414 start_codon:yes stop_codon:yes gene_type:complete
MKKQIYKSTNNELKLVVGCTWEDEKVYPLTPEEVRQFIESWAFINTNYGRTDLGVEYYVDIRIDGEWNKSDSKTRSCVEICEYDDTKQYVKLNKKNFSVWCKPQNGWTINKKYARHNLRPVDGINSWGKSWITITKK